MLDHDSYSQDMTGAMTTERWLFLMTADRRTAETSGSLKAVGVWQPRPPFPSVLLRAQRRDLVRVFYFTNKLFFKQFFFFISSPDSQF